MFHDDREGLFNALNSREAAQENASAAVETGYDAARANAFATAHPKISPVGVYLCSTDSHCFDGATGKCIRCGLPRAEANAPTLGAKVPDLGASSTPFEVRAPIESSPEFPGAAASSVLPSRFAVAAGRPLRILHVDDEPAVSRAMGKLLGQRGHTVAASTMPVTALDYFDVVLIDWQPHGPAQRRICRKADTPFVILTGDAEQCLRDLITELEGKVDGITILEKPVDAAVLEKALREAVG